MERELFDLIDAHVTMRIIEFHQALVERGQIEPPPPGYGVIGDCTADRAAGANQFPQRCD